MKPRKRRRRCSLGLGRVSLLSGNAAQIGGCQVRSLQRVKTLTGGVSDEVHHLVFAHLVEACALKRRSQAATDGVQRNGIECQQKGNEHQRAPESTSRLSNHQRTRNLWEAPVLSGTFCTRGVVLCVTPKLWILNTTDCPDSTNLLPLPRISCLAQVHCTSGI